jgi:NADH-quinone oxidoreductase subunit N
MNSLISITVLGILTMMVGVWHLKKWNVPVIIAGLLVSLLLNIADWNTSIHYFNEMMIVDNYAIAFNGVLIFSSILVFMFASNYYRSVERPLEDVYSLMIFSLAGGLIMTSFANLAMLFIGIEILSISMYVLAGSKKFDLASNEASLKYFLTGSFATGFLLFGIALIYGTTGSFNMAEITTFVNQNILHLPDYFKVGLLFIMIGLAFKLAIAPFHFWAPDVYHGSPTLITAYMATVVKIAGIAAFYRLFATCFISVPGLWVNTLVVLSAITILLGNLVGVYQTNMKRMLAYSSISHAGYMLLGLIALNQLSASSLLLYTAAYSIATITAFGIIILVREVRRNDDLETFNGLARTNPYMAFTLSFALMSLTGIPPLAGFVAKYYIFTTAIQSGYLWLVLIAIAGSAISAVYYFKPIIAMYLREGDWPAIPVTRSYRLQIIAMTILTLLLGLLPGLLLII